MEYGSNTPNGPTVQNHAGLVEHSTDTELVQVDLVEGHVLEIPGRKEIVTATLIVQVKIYAILIYCIFI